MACLLALLALISPRLALIAIALLNDMISRAFDGVLVPLIGFFILPWTTLAYVVMYDIGAPSGEVTGFEWLLVLVAFLADIGVWGGGSRARRGD